MKTQDEWKMDWCYEIGIDAVFARSMDIAVSLANSKYELDHEAKGKSKFIMLVYREAVCRKIEIPYSLQLWVAHGFDQYLKDEKSTLQAAFKAIKPPKGNRKKTISMLRRNMIMHILIKNFNLEPFNAAELLSTASGAIPNDIPESIKHFIIEGRVNSSTPESILSFYHRSSKPSEIEKINAVTKWDDYDDFILTY